MLTQCARRTKTTYVSFTFTPTSFRTHMLSVFCFILVQVKYKSSAFPTVARMNLSEVTLLKVCEELRRWETSVLFV